MPLGLFPLPTDQVLADTLGRLRSALATHDFSAAASLPFQGKNRHVVFDVENVRRYVRRELGVTEMSAVAPLLYRAFGRHHAEALSLFKFFTLNKPLALPHLQRLLGQALVEDLIQLEMLVPQEGKLCTRLRATPVEHLVCFHDTFSIHDDEKLTHVFFGRCSVRLARSVQQIRRSGVRLKRSLDLCTGGGVEAMLSAAFADEVVGVDINPRAVAMARAAAAANEIRNASFVNADLFDGASGRFDLVTANTPFLLLRDTSKATSGKGGEYGVEVALRIFGGLEDVLEPEGRARLVVSTAWVGKRSILVERLEHLLAGQFWKIRLRPINTYYDSALFDLYESLGVKHCTLYVAEIERSDQGLDVAVVPEPLPMSVLQQIDVTLRRYQGRRRSAEAAG